MSQLHLPMLFAVGDFADMMGVSSTHIRHAAKNFVYGHTEGGSRSKLPAGWGAVMFGGIYVIFDLQDADYVYALFNAERPNHD